MQYVTIPLGPTNVPANLDIKEMDEPVVLKVRVMSYKILDVKYELSLCLSAGFKMNCKCTPRKEVPRGRLLFRIT